MYIRKSPKENPEMYCINMQDKGWVIIAGDTRVNPILAYSHENNGARGTVISEQSITINPNTTIEIGGGCVV